MSTSSYAHGQGERITKLFSMRTAQRDAAFIIPFILPTSRILDVGCGPGSITCDFGELASKGEVVGVDASLDAVQKAEKLAKDRDLSNIAFHAGDVTKSLDFADEEFDIVFCHQVLSHLSDPAQALREMRRVAKPGGIVAAREVIDFIWHPSTKQLRTLDFWHFAAIRQPEINGRCVAENIPSYAQEAGFKPENSVFNISGQMWWRKDERELILTAMHALLGEQGTLRPKAVNAGAMEKELEEALSEVAKWVEDPTAWLTGLSVEVFYRN